MSRRRIEKASLMQQALAALIVASGLGLPATVFAEANSPSSTIELSGAVPKACVIGQPAAVTLALGALAGPDGRVSSTLASSSVSATTTISDAWCNAPSILSLNGEPMALSSPPGYATPPGFARLVTYDANLSGWPSNLHDRPRIGDAAKTTTADVAHGAANLTLKISSLAALNAAGTADDTSAVLEAGDYAGQVVIAVTVQ